MSELNNNIQNDVESDIFSAPKRKIDAKYKRSVDLKRQLKALIIIGVVIVFAAISVFVLKLLLKEDPPPKEEIILLDGEVLGPQGRIFIMDPVGNSDILSIKIHNEYGDWEIINNPNYGYYIKDMPSALCDTTKIPYLFTAAGYTLSIERISTDVNDFSEYGLADADNPAWYEITDRHGNIHKLYIGNMIVSNAGYYVRYDGRNAVYVLDASIANTLLVPVETMIYPLLSYSNSMIVALLAQEGIQLPSGYEYCYITNFKLKRDNELFISFQGATGADANNSSTLHNLTEPAGYKLNDNYLDVLYKFQEFKGEQTIKYNPTKEDLEEYGLTTPKYQLSFNWGYYPTEIWFSERNENGNFYAYSPVPDFNIITEINYDDAAWLEWDLIDWIQRPLYQEDIKKVKEIEIKTDACSYSFKLTSNANGLESVYEAISGKYISDLDNFKQFYMALLLTSSLDYAELNDEEIKELTSTGEYLYLKVTMNDGRKLEYKFYPYHTRKSYFTLNGEGNFYIVRDRMIKLIDDAAKTLTGERIFADANN